MLAAKPMCVHCGQRPATEADHQPPISRHRHLKGSGCCKQVPSCSPCARRQGADLANGVPVPMLEMETPEAIEDPVGFPRDHEIWQRPWLQQLVANMPADACWPRLMSAPHPNAVGSHGPAFARWFKLRRGFALRWWQLLVATRLLEHDSAKSLVWEEALMSTSRQLGKTVLTGGLAEWRIEHAHLFGGGEQLALSTGSNLSVLHECHRPYRTYGYLHDDEFRVLTANGKEAIEHLPSNSRWLVRAKDSVYGLSADFVSVDECWAIAASVIDDGVTPTMAARPMPQLLLLSTAHRLATSLMMDRRSSALEALADPFGEALLIEWSAPPDADVHDREAWRLASPHWDHRRERLVARALTRALAGRSDDPSEPDPMESFRSQWLNQWPTRRVKVGKGEPLLMTGAWSARERAMPLNDLPGVIGIEDNHGRGAAVALAVLHEDTTYEVGGWCFDSWDEALRWAVKVAEAHPGSTLVHGASLIIPARSFPSGTEIHKYTASHLRLGLPLVRSLVLEARIAYDPDDATDLTAQVDDARVVRTATGGLGLVAGARADCLKSLTWALLHAETPRPTPAFE